MSRQNYRLLHGKKTSGDSALGSILPVALRPEDDRPNVLVPRQTPLQKVFIKVFVSHQADESARHLATLHCIEISASDHVNLERTKNPPTISIGNHWPFRPLASGAGNPLKFFGSEKQQRARLLSATSTTKRFLSQNNFVTLKMHNIGMTKVL